MLKVNYAVIQDADIYIDGSDFHLFIGCKFRHCNFFVSGEFKTPALENCILEQCKLEFEEFLGSWTGKDCLVSNDCVIPVKNKQDE
jgi:hypothetical protein